MTEAHRSVLRVLGVAASLLVSGVVVAIVLEHQGTVGHPDIVDYMLRARA